MNTNYEEQEIKVLNVDPELLQEKLTALGATLEFDGERIITHLDTPERTLLHQGKFLKLTEEGTTKLTLGQPLVDGKRAEIKIKVSRKEEAIALFTGLGYVPIAEARARRISYVWNGIDIDIDSFENIDPFVEIDLGESGKSLEEIITQLDLVENEQAVMGTPDIFEKKYARNYFEDFAIVKP